MTPDGPAAVTARACQPAGRRLRARLPRAPRDRLWGQGLARCCGRAAARGRPQPARRDGRRPPPWKTSRSARGTRLAKRERQLPRPTTTTAWVRLRHWRASLGRSRWMDRDDAPRGDARLSQRETAHQTGTASNLTQYRL